MKAIRPSITMLLTAAFATGGCEIGDDTTNAPDAATPEEADLGELAAPLPAGCPSVNLKTDAGAKGDGVTNDTAAFQRAAKMIQDRGCGELIIPPAIYIVGKQIKKTNPAAPGPFYEGRPIFTVDGLSYLRIYGYGATIRTASGLHFGGFDPTTGAPVDVTGGLDYAAHVGRTFEIEGSDNVWIGGVELDGNNGNLILGGQWGDKQRQGQATGIRLSMCLKATVVDVHTHHNGLDGISIGHGQEAPLVKKPHRLIRVVSEYNGRQGLSWGGWGLEAIDCKFNHTAKAINHGGGVDDGLPMRAAPSAGVDIEPNQGSFARDGHFVRCEFVDNAGVGMDADKGDGAYSTFEDCTFWGTTNYSVWANRPGLRFINSRFYGTAVHPHDGHSDANPSVPNPALATYFEGCTFEDKPWIDGTVQRAGYLVTIGPNEGDGVTFKNCTFRNHEVRAVLAGGTATKEIFDGGTFMHDNAHLAAGSAQSSFQGSQLTSVRFLESTAISTGGKSYYIGTSSVRVMAPPTGARSTTVEGPSIKWDSANAAGKTGVIAPDAY